jgi:hypothetical protein
VALDLLVLALVLIGGREMQEVVPDDLATAIQERRRRVVPRVAPETFHHCRGNAPALRARRLKLAAHAPRGSGQPLRIPR